MTTTKAIKTFFEPPTVTMDELKELKRALSQPDWDAFGQEVCAALGVAWDAPPKQ